MKKAITALMLPAMLLAASCSSDKAPAADPSATPSTFGDSISYYLGRTAGAQLNDEYAHMTDEQKAQFNSADFLAGLNTLLSADSVSASYIAGLSQALQLAQMTLQMRQAGIDIDPALFIAQLHDRLTADSVNAEQMEADIATVTALEARAHAMIQQATLEKVNENKIRAEKFLDEKRKANPSIGVTASGLTYEITKQGTGEVAQPGSVVPAIVSATSLSGKELFSTGGKPQPVNSQTTMPGLGEALTTLPGGTIATLYIPASLAFGDQGTPDGSVLPGELVIVELEIID
ncbi:MAG: hypothetical protein K2K79_05620 [Paramuribaculum sp.]|nr:hypothetical protein [Paramuribaculum sp.]